MVDAANDRATLHMRTVGAGDRMIVAIHGWSGTHATYTPIERFVPDGTVLVSVDLPGCGRSPAPTSWTLETIADTVAREIRSRADGAVEIVGNCSGAIVALVVAERHPTLVARLALIDPFAYVPWYFAVFLHPRIGRRAYMTTFANPLGRWLTNRSLRSRRTRESHLTASFQEVDHEATLRYLALLGSAGDVRRFAGIAAPVDILHGARTFSAVRRSVALWRAQWPSARVHEIAGAGHLPIEEAPDAVARIIFRSS